MSFRASLGAMLAIVALGTWQAYSAFDTFFELTPAENAVPANELWFFAGPLTFFLAGSLGFLSTAMAHFARHPVSKRFSIILVWVPLLWLALGAMLFTWLDCVASSFKSSALDHLWNSLTIALPMALAAACLFNIAQLVRNKPPDAVVAPSSQRKKIAFMAGRVFLWVVASAASILAVAASAVLLLLSSCEPPSLSELARRFPGQRSDLETLIQMSDRDADFSVIDPGWLQSSGGMIIDDPALPVPAPQLLHGDHSPKSSMSLERWNEYRRIFKRDHITQGIRRWKGDAFILVKSEGLLDRGISNGFVYCGPGPEHAYPPCSSQETRGEQLATGNREGYSFIKLADRWYAYSEGPG